MEVYLIEAEDGSRWIGDYPDDDIIHGNILLGRDVNVFVTEIPDEEISFQGESPDFGFLEDLGDDIYQKYDWKDYTYYHA